MSILDKALPSLQKSGIKISKEDVISPPGFFLEGIEQEQHIKCAMITLEIVERIFDKPYGEVLAGFRKGEITTQTQISLLFSLMATNRWYHDIEEPTEEVLAKAVWGNPLSKELLRVLSISMLHFFYHLELVDEGTKISSTSKVKKKKKGLFSLMT